MEDKAEWDERIKDNSVKKSMDAAAAVVRALIRGQTKLQGVLISGTPGVGKDTLVARVARSQRVHLHNATVVTDAGLYDLLAEGHQFVYLNECEKAFNSNTAPNLKKALDTDRRNRVITRNIFNAPPGFICDTKFICVMNPDWGDVTKLPPHQAAIKSRLIYVRINSDRYALWEYFVYQTLFGTVLHEPTSYPVHVVNQALEYFTTNLWKLSEVSARLLGEIAEYINTFPATWRELADQTALLPPAHWITGKEIPPVPQIGGKKKKRKNKKQRARGRAAREAAAAAAQRTMAELKKQVLGEAPKPQPEPTKPAQPAAKVTRPAERLTPSMLSRNAQRLREVQSALARGLSQKEIAARFNLAVTTVSLVKTGKIGIRPEARH